MMKQKKGVKRIPKKLRLKSMPKVKTGGISKKKQEDMRVFMAELLEDGRLGKYTPEQMGEMCAVSTNCARRYIKLTYEDSMPLDVSAIKKRSAKLFERLERNLYDVIDEAEELGDSRSKLVVLERAPKFLKDFGCFLEEWGFKKKLAAEINIKSSQSVDTAFLQEIRQLK